MADPDSTKKRVEEEQDQEGVKERLEREHGELLEELRALIPGAEVLFGFLLAIRFTSQFKELTSGQEHVFFVNAFDDRHRTRPLSCAGGLSPYPLPRGRQGDHAAQGQS